MQGRFFSLVNVMFTGFMPLGMAVFGPLAEVVRIQTMVIVCAAFIILLGLSTLQNKEFYREGITAISSKTEESIAADQVNKEADNYGS